MEKATGYVFLLLFLFIGSTLLVLDFPLLFAPRRSDREVVFRSGYNDISRDMVVDSHGNVIIVGGRMEREQFSMSKFYALKVSPIGEEVWAMVWNSSQSDMLTSVAVDSDDNILLAGILGFNQANSTGLVMKLSPVGELIWEVEFPGLEYHWYWWPPRSAFFGVEIDAVTNDIYVVGSLIEGTQRTLIARLNSSGSEQWRTEWAGSFEFNGTDATTFWLSSNDEIIVAGRVYGEDEPYDPFIDFYIECFIAAFDFNGTYKWNSSLNSPFWSGVEIGQNEFVTSTDSWRGYNEVTRYTYNFEELSCFDLVVDRHSISIEGFSLNGSENIIGHGRIKSLIAGKSVTKELSPLFSGPQAPQTLILSTMITGELEWFDYLVLGRMSEPCGAVFNSEHQLIIGGHTSDWSLYENNFFIVFGFRKTPFYPSYQLILLGFFPVLNILAVAMLHELSISLKKGRSFLGIRRPELNLKNSIQGLLKSQLVVFLFLYVFLIGFIGGGGPPPLLTYLPQWVSAMFWSLPLGISVLGLFYYRERRRQQGGLEQVEISNHTEPTDFEES
ncbi:MAG: hypothetical protein ACFFFC_19915 [Candidatus Thorarchaeota archaeon]